MNVQIWIKRFRIYIHPNLFTVSTYASSKIRKYILEVKDATKGPMMVIGNKLDLQTSTDNGRHVSTQEGKELAEVILTT